MLGITGFQWHSRCRNLTVIAMLAGVMSLGAADAPGELRTWRDKTGVFEFEGEFVQQTAKDVTLRKADGTTKTLPINALCDEDREYLRSLKPPGQGDKKPSPGKKPATKSPSAAKSGASKKMESEKSMTGKSKGRDPADTKSPASGKGNASPSESDEGAKSREANPVSDRPRFPKSKAKPVKDGSFLMDNASVVKHKPADLPEGLEADPGPATAVPYGAFTAAPVDAYDRVSGPFVLDAEKGIVATAIGRNVITKPEETRGRIYVGSLKEGSCRPVYDVKEKLIVYDHDPETDRTLLVSGMDHAGHGGDLVLLEGLCQGEPRQLLRRKLPGSGKPGFQPKFEWVVLMDGSYVLGKIQSKLYAWNVETAKNLYTIDDMNTDHLVMSPGRRYLYVGVSGGAAILDPLNGSLLGFLPGAVPNLNPEIVCHPDGRQIALASGSEMVVYDVTTNERTLYARFANHIGHNPIGWIADKLFLNGRGEIFHTDQCLVYWNYSLALTSRRIPFPNGLLTATKNDVCHVAALRLPSPMAEAAARSFDEPTDELFVLRPGSKVSLRVEVVDGVDKTSVEENLRSAVAETHWEVAQQTDIEVVAVIGRGKQQQLGFRDSRKRGRNDTAVITPFTARCEIRKAGEVLWSRETFNLVPPLLILQEDETLQEAVSRFERPDAEFFRRLNLPSIIPRKEIQFGLGHSEIHGSEWKEIPHRLEKAPGGPGQKPARPPGPVAGLTFGPVTAR